MLGEFIGTWLVIGLIALVAKIAITIIDKGGEDNEK